MSKQIVTANRLRDGLVVFRAGNAWTERFDQALPVEAAAAEELVKRIAAEEFTEVVGVYAIDQDDASARETIRVKGPTVRRDLGKQAKG